MIMELFVLCNKNDDFVNICKKEFKDTEVIETSSFSGYYDAFILIIPLVALTIQTIDFFWNHFSKPHNTGRLIVKKDKTKISLEGYTKDEILEILKEITNENNL